MAQVTVTVTGDPQNPTVTLSPTPVTLNPGDILEWEFDGVPSDCVPGILFDSPLGPFEALEISNGNLIQGRGNIGGSQTSYSYIARVFDANGFRGTAASGVVQNQVTAQDTSPSVVVTCQTEINPETGQVTVVKINFDNLTLGLFMNDTAFWQVSGLPLGYFVTFRFDLEGAESILGPFKSLLYVRALAEESLGVVRIIGARFTPPDPMQGEFTYHIDVRDPTGVVVKSSDPQIDNLGAPPQQMDDGDAS